MKRKVTQETISRTMEITAEGKKGLLGLKRSELKTIIATVSYRWNGRNPKVAITLDPLDDRGEKSLDTWVAHKIHSFLGEHTKEADTAQFIGSGCIKVKWKGLFEIKNLDAIMQSLVSEIENKSI